MIVIANDDGKKMVERDELYPFLEEYAYLAGVELTLVGAGERPDFVCEKRGRRYGLELVKAMRDPVQRGWEVILGSDSHLHGLDAAALVQEVAYSKDKKRRSPGWRYPKSTILVIQLVGSDGEEMASYLDDQLMDEMAETGFREIWIADYSPMEPYGTIQLIGVKPKRWRGAHPHRFYGMKPFG
ncbi:MAG: hypothetical protein FJW34_23520 [Acidobacteria bacterium]|nr:hypothetical protein [Acidobacteriota bacterium]